MIKKHMLILFTTALLIVPLFLLFSVQTLMAYEKEINSLSEALAEKIVVSGKKTLAVVDFTDLQGNVTELGRFLAEEFSVTLAGLGKGFEIVDRTHLKSIVSEHKLSLTGIIDPKTARQLGKIAGVEAIITGTITPFGDSVRLTVKALDTETARLIIGTKGNIAKTKAIEELLAREIESVSRVSATEKPSLARAKHQVKPGYKLQTVRSNNFTFELREARLSGASIMFDLSITNYGQDREICYRNIRIFDNFGNEHNTRQVQLGNKMAKCNRRYKLVTGIPTKSTLYFEKVSQRTEWIALLEFQCLPRRGKKFIVQFRNIPISK